MAKNALLRMLCAALMLAIAAPSHADSWLLPEPTTYFSADRLTRLRVVPRELTSQLDYFEDKLRGKERAGQDRSSRNAKPRGILERRIPGGQWRAVWNRPLVNDVAPVNALVANGGRYVVTLDEWHAVGTSANAIVIYDIAGKTIRALPLTRLLPAVYIKALPHSVSSIDWRGDARLSPDGQRLILPIVMPDDSDDARRNPSYVDRSIRLSDGAIVADTSLYWARVLMQATMVANAHDADEQARRNFLVAPLRGPMPPTETGWHDYLREVFYRLDPGVSFDWDKEGAHVGTMVLRDPRDPAYAASEGWLREALLEKREPDDVLAIAALSSPEHLLVTLDHILSRAPRGGLRGTRIYVAIPAAFKARTMAIFSRSGTRVMCLDPSLPIPQRPERLKRM